MNAEDSFNQVKWLLGLMPGVEVVWAQHASSDARLGLAVRSPSTLALLAHFTLAANVTLAVEVDWQWKGEQDDPECIRYDLRVSREPEPYDPPSRLQIVGFYLVRYLKESGQLAPNEADGLLRAWNCSLE